MGGAVFRKIDDEDEEVRRMTETLLEVLAESEEQCWFLRRRAEIPHKLGKALAILELSTLAREDVPPVELVVDVNAREPCLAAPPMLERHIPVEVKCQRVTTIRRAVMPLNLAFGRRRPGPRLNGISRLRLSLDQNLTSVGSLLFLPPNWRIKR